MEFCNNVFSLEGPIAIGKSSILDALRNRGCVIFPEPVETWKPALDRFYQEQAEGRIDDAIQAAVDLQFRVIESLEERHYDILTTDFGDTPVVMERSLLAALSVFTSINAEDYPNPHQWEKVRHSLWDGCEMYESELHRIALHHDDVNVLIERTRNRQGSDHIADINYLKKVYEKSTEFEDDCNLIVNVTNKEVNDIADEIKREIDEFLITL